MFDLTGKTALVTGSTQGIGFSIAKMLSQYGAKVFINGVSSMEKCIKASEQIQNSVPVTADISKPEGIECLYAKTGDVDILILNASVQYKKQWNAFSEEEFDAQFDCNVKGCYLLVQKYAKGMIAQKWGRIVTIGSVNQYNNHPELSVYGMTKAALMKMVENTASNLAPFGVTINNVAPGAIETPRNEDAFNDSEFKKKVESMIPCGYIGKPEDISPAVLLLCSDEGRYITGAEIKIDGGMSL